MDVYIIQDSDDEIIAVYSSAKKAVLFAHEHLNVKAVDARLSLHFKDLKDKNSTIVEGLEFNDWLAVTKRRLRGRRH